MNFAVGGQAQQIKKWAGSKMTLPYRSPCLRQIGSRRRATTLEGAGSYAGDTLHPPHDDEGLNRRSAVSVVGIPERSPWIFVRNVCQNPGSLS